MVVPFVEREKRVTNEFLDVVYKRVESSNDIEKEKFLRYIDCQKKVLNEESLNEKNNKRENEEKGKENENEKGSTFQENFKSLKEVFESFSKLSKIVNDKYYEIKKNDEKLANDLLNFKKKYQNYLINVKLEAIRMKNGYLPILDILEMYTEELNENKKVPKEIKKKFEIPLIRFIKQMNSEKINELMNESKILQQEALELTEKVDKSKDIFRNKQIFKALICSLGILAASSVIIVFFPVMPLGLVVALSIIGAFSIVSFFICGYINMDKAITQHKNQLENIKSQINDVENRLNKILNELVSLKGEEENLNDMYKEFGENLVLMTFNSSISCSRKIYEISQKLFELSSEYLESLDI